jgi:hypothetical protein
MSCYCVCVGGGGVSSPLVRSCGGVGAADEQEPDMVEPNVEEPFGF